MLITRLSILAFATACALPAAAATALLPGVNCSANGSVDKPSTGALLNVTPGAGSGIKFYCPIPRTKVGAGIVTITVYAKLNSASYPFDCTIVSTLPNGSQYDVASIVFPTTTPSNGGYSTSVGAQVSVPPATLPGPATVHMRCDVPNPTSGNAGIMGYRVDD